MAGDHRAPTDLGFDPAWDTVRSDRTVLLVARTLTSAVRLLDVLDVFRGDFRVRPVFAIDDGTRSGTGVRELLEAAGVRQIVPWSALPTGYDLAIAASEQVDLDKITSTIVVLPHGVGFNKYVPDGTDTGRRIAGLPPAAAIRTGRVRLVLSHGDQREQLAAADPGIAGQTVVTGDPTFDRLLASSVLRDRYRAALDGEGRTVVLLSSTWGAESAFGRWRELPRRLLAELPADETRVVAALHPNIWARHSPAVIRTWLADCLDSGLRLLPPEHGWQAALVASDLVVGDHGSVTLLAAGLGKPVVLAAFGPEAEVVPGTPVAELGRMAGRLDSSVSLPDQVDKAIADHDPGRYASIVARTFAHVGEATDRLREVIYRELRLSPPTTAPLLRRFPAPTAEPYSSTAFDVYTEFAVPRLVTLRRFPRPVHAGHGVRHLAVDEQCSDLRLTQAASVLTRSSAGGEGAAREWAERALRHFPGALVTAAATATGCVAAVRVGGVFVVLGDADALVLGSTLHACLLAGDLSDGVLRVQVGVRLVECQLRALESSP